LPDIRRVPVEKLTQLLALIELLLRFEGLKCRRIDEQKEHELLMLIGLYFAKEKRKKSLLIDDLHLSLATANRMIDRLKSEKLILVEQGDSRSPVLVSITPRGRTYVEHKLEEQGQKMSNLRTVWIDEDKRQKVMGLFNELRTRLVELLQE
jgi:DNA-binding MarR family transcriptional regulator